MAKKLLLVVNPNAGKMKAGAALLDLVREFALSGYDVTVFPTEKKFDAENKIRKSGANYDLIVCYGGDGTLSETVNGLAKLSKNYERIVPFGFIPAGTANDFAATVGMPSDMKEAARTIIEGRHRSLDIGGFNGGYFIYVAAFGLFTSVSYTVPQEMKKTFGHLAYVMEGIRQTADIPSHRLTVEYNGKVVKDDFVVGLITNTTSVAGLLKLDKAKVKLNDGKFELILIKDPKNPVLLSKLIMDLSLQRFDPQYVIFEKTPRVIIRSPNALQWCLDGEDGGFHSEAVITNLPKKTLLRI